MAYYIFDSPLSPVWAEGSAKEKNDSRGPLYRYFNFAIMATTISLVMWALVHGKTTPSNEKLVETFWGLILLEALLITSLDFFSNNRKPKHPQNRARSRFITLSVFWAYIVASVIN